MWKITYNIFLLLILMSLNSCNKSISEKIIFADNVVVAHRGAWKSNNLPQNSIASLKQAITLGCTGSEFDVRMTSDDVLIVTHDAKYQGLEVEESTYAELSKFKLSNGETLPTLKEYINAAMQDNTATGLVCELKPSKVEERNIIIAEKVLKLVKELKAESYIKAYISFSYAILKRIIEIDPTAKTHYLDGSKSPEELKKDKISGLDYAVSKLKNRPDWIASAKQHNLILNAWTANKIEDIDWLLANEFDYITTDEPELVFKKINIIMLSKSSKD